jgi:hypothetical protein
MGSSKRARLKPHSMFFVQTPGGFIFQVLLNAKNDEARIPRGAGEASSAVRPDGARKSFSVELCRRP